MYLLKNILVISLQLKTTISYINIIVIVHLISYLNAHALVHVKTLTAYALGAQTCLFMWRFKGGGSSLGKLSGWNCASDLRSAALMLIKLNFIFRELEVSGISYVMERQKWQIRHAIFYLFSQPKQCKPCPNYKQVNDKTLYCSIMNYVCFCCCNSGVKLIVGQFV